MLNIKYTSFTLILIFGFSPAFTQTLKTIDSLQTQYQTCLDKGQNMLGCSQAFYYQMDSLLNMQYKELRLRCDSIQKENLKDEQRAWLSKRDKQFSQNKQRVKRETKKDGDDGGEDETMILTDANATFVKLRVIELLNSLPQNYSSEKYKVNPTGFYSLDSKTEIKNDETYGYFGDIKVKSIANNKVALRLYVCKGAPSYNSGSLEDTLIITNNKAVYRNAEFDSSCKIEFTFFRQGIKVEEVTCKLGYALGRAISNGYYKRISYKIPTTKDLMEN